MWILNIFKEKTESIPVEKLEFIPVDCIFNSIVKDLDDKIFSDWKITYGTFECWKNIKKDYAITLSPLEQMGWLSNISQKYFNKTQRTILYQKCREMREAQRKIEEDAARIEEHKFLKSKFPQCFN